MQTRYLTLVLLAVLVGFAGGFASHAFFGHQSAVSGAESTTLDFDSDIESFAYSEKGVVKVKKLGDRTFSVDAISPGMCVLSFSAADDGERPDHLRNRFIVSVSPDKKLTVQKTTFWAGGML